MKHLLLFLIVGWVFSSCSSVTYFSDKLDDLPQVSFNSYTTEDQCDQTINPIMAQRIANAINIQMRNRSYMRSEEPDIIIQYFVKNTTKKIVEECHISYDRWIGGETCQDRVITYEEGTIVIDFINTDDNRIFWHGAITGPALSRMKSPNEKINKMVGKLFDIYFSEQ